MKGLFYMGNPAGGLVLALLLSLAAPELSAAPQRRSADDVFRKWKSWQYVYGDQLPGRVEVTDQSMDMLFEEFPSEMYERAGFLGLTASDFRSSLSSSDAKKRFTSAMKGIVPELSDDLPAFVNRLRQHGFTSEEINTAEEAAGASRLGGIYRRVLVVPLAAAGQGSEERLFGLANRMFEYAFGAEHGEQFRRFLYDPGSYPLARLFYANIWYRLSGNGWRIWHKDVLTALHRESARGREIVYIAGGTDFYHLIKAGVYRIRIIDPMLPSQKKYYSEGWEYLIGCSKGDEIRFGEERILLRREGCIRTGSFTTEELSDGQRHTLPEVVVRWTVLDEDGKSRGAVIYERRFARQDDFFVNRDQRLLLSFNELAYATDPGPDGWGMDSEKWPSDIQIYVKQLRRPVGKTECVNLKKAARSPFSFIRLGSSID